MVVSVWWWGVMAVMVGGGSSDSCECVMVGV